MNGDPEECLRCPLFGCRAVFFDQQSTADHASACPYLMTGWYWCSSCSCPEQFFKHEYLGSVKAKALAFKSGFGRWTSFKTRESQPRAPTGIAQCYDTTSNSNQQAGFHAAHFENRRILEHGGLNIEYEMPSDEQLCRPQINIGADPQSHWDVNSFHQVNLRPLNASFGKLRELALVVHHKWISILSNSASPYWPCTSYSTDNLVRIGIGVWGEVLNGDALDSSRTSMRTCAELFALMLVACAATILMHCREDPIDWDDFFKDMLRWQCVLQDETEVIRFLTIMATLFGTPTVDSIFISPGSQSANLLLDLRDGPIVKGYSLFRDGEILVMFAYQV